MEYSLDMKKDYRTRLLTVRTAEAEHEAIRQIAASHGMSMSDYARSRLLPASRPPEPYQPQFNGIDHWSAVDGARGRDADPDPDP
jgi:hypothetical protein